ncbi:symporter small accessory protein [Sporomusa sp.]|uniref:symporter small accessory protein n=1 Tax=Sporomusa sp. TaxID=2078658 RepID=UPI002C7B2F2E|nr:symporter small accessory protein [Sporomusa sp.]HWR42282.1 hypothetical protein [Sporomusa sp.]
MFGLTDPWIALAYISCLGSTALCMGVNTLATAPWTYIDPLVITLPISALVLVAASLLTQPVPQTVTEGR